MDVKRLQEEFDQHIKENADLLLERTGGYLAPSLWRSSSADGILPKTHQTDLKCPQCHCLLMTDVHEGLLFCRQHDCSYSRSLEEGEL